MLRPVDIAVLLKLTLQGAAEMSFQQLASDLPSLTLRSSRLL
jgi:hypothetical protein